MHSITSHCTRVSNWLQMIADPLLPIMIMIIIMIMIMAPLMIIGRNAPGNSVDGARCKKFLQHFPQSVKNLSNGKSVKWKIFQITLKWNSIVYSTINAQLLRCLRESFQLILCGNSRRSVSPVMCPAFPEGSFIFIFIMMMEIMCTMYDNITTSHRCVLQGSTWFLPGLAWNKISFDR